MVKYPVYRCRDCGNHVVPDATIGSPLTPCRCGSGEMEYHELVGGRFER